MDLQPGRSPAESVKEDSRHLRGSIVEELELERPDFSKETVQILKFHGVYQQTDRDARKQGLGQVYGSMVRVGVPGGVLSPEQYLVLDRLADEAGDGGLRVTTRQDIQFHRVQKSNVRNLIRTLNANLLGTLAACGDVVRNVTACPAPMDDAQREEIQKYVRSIARRLKPKTRAYYEIWLDGEKAYAAESTEGEAEPLYGPGYLPRKFKIGFASPGDNCIDVYTNDCGVVPVIEGERLTAFVLLAGGGLGMSPGVKATHPRLATPLCTVEPSQLEETIEAIVTIHRDFSNRANRKLARLKYVIEEIGIEAFTAELAKRVGRQLDPPRPLTWNSGDDHFGWHAQGDGRWFLGIPVLSGRIKDHDGVAWRTAFREAVTQFRAGVRLTTQQNVLLTDIQAADRAGVERLLGAHGIRLAGQLPPVLRDSLACPALPTCGLAITEAERILPSVIRDIQAELYDAGLPAQAITVRITGCPNGCARPYNAEIGIVGQSIDMYAIYLGGSHVGTRLGFVYADNVKRGSLRSTLRPVIQFYKESRAAGEAFGDFCHRIGLESLRAQGEAVLR
jgi:sulfite reductase (ferredoxin)